MPMEQPVSIGFDIRLQKCKLWRAQQDFQWSQRVDILSSNVLDKSVSKLNEIVNNGVVANVPKCKCVNFPSTYPYGTPLS